MTHLARTKLIQIRVTEEELAKAEYIALLQGMTVSELVRQRILKQQPKELTTTVSRQALVGLVQIYNSLNVINKNIGNGLNANAIPELKKMQALLKKICSEVIL